MNFDNADVCDFPLSRGEFVTVDDYESLGEVSALSGAMIHVRFCTPEIHDGIPVVAVIAPRDCVHRVTHSGKAA